MDQNKNSMSIILNAATSNEDVRVVKQAQATNKPGSLAQIGQIPGDETSTAPAQAELLGRVLDLQKSDAELREAASCWAVYSAGNLARQVLTASGVYVLMPGDEKKGALAFAGMENPANTTPIVKLDVKVFETPARMQAFEPTIMGPHLPKYTWENCEPIIERTMASEDSTYGQLSAKDLNIITLKTE